MFHKKRFFDNELKGVGQHWSHSNNRKCFKRFGEALFFNVPVLYTTKVHKIRIQSGS